MIHVANSDKFFDTIIVGAGILGLWAARHAIKRGEKVAVIEKRQVGAGASGGFLGALMPHMPDSWNAKKQFQYDGLTSIEAAIAELEADTGLDCGFRRCGRVMPIPHDRIMPQVERRLAGAKTHWDDAFSLEVTDAGDGWLDPNMAPHGIQKDTLSARINPRACLEALSAYVRPRCDLMEGIGVEAFVFTGNNQSGEVTLSNGDVLNSSKMIVANGWEAYPLLQPWLGPLNDNKPIGRGVKGQAVLVELDHDDDLPIVYHDGTYIVPHKDNRVAIGSTSVNDWNGEPDAFDPGDMLFYQKAIELVPALKNAPIIDRWAGVRPRNTIDGRGTSPWLGVVPGNENLIALIGGFKITFGVAHIDFAGGEGFVG